MAIIGAFARRLVNNVVFLSDTCQSTQRSVWRRTHRKEFNLCLQIYAEDNENGDGFRHSRAVLLDGFRPGEQVQNFPAEMQLQTAAHIVKAIQSQLKN